MRPVSAVRRRAPPRALARGAAVRSVRCRASAARRRGRSPRRGPWRRHGTRSPRKRSAVSASPVARCRGRELEREHCRVEEVIGFAHVREPAVEGAFGVFRGRRRRAPGARRGSVRAAHSASFHARAGTASRSVSSTDNAVASSVAASASGSSRHASPTWACATHNSRMRGAAGVFVSLISSRQRRQCVLAVRRHCCTVAASFRGAADASSAAAKCASALILSMAQLLLASRPAVATRSAAAGSPAASSQATAARAKSMVSRTPA